MRHYEIVLVVHPDQSEQVSAMVERYQSSISAADGKVHRFEDWGRRLLAYPIANVVKAHYVMMNIECSAETLAELQSAFRFNDAIIRHLVVLQDGPVTDMSAILLQKDEKPERPDRGDRGDRPDRNRRRDSEGSDDKASTDDDDDADEDSDDTDAKAA